MRSSKKRSRSSQNRPRTLGNIINRVFDSSGPEGKVRGTPQQIIEKYQMLARDAQLSNDRVATENFLQHAEHYTRMLAEAMREMGAEQEARQQQYQQSNGQNGGQGGQNGGQNGNHTGGQNGNQNGGQHRGERQTDRQSDRSDRQPERQPDRQPDRQYDRPDRGERSDRGDRRPETFRDQRDEREPVAAAVAEVIDLGGGDDSGLIDTPEAVIMPPLRFRTDKPDAEEHAAPREDPAPRRARGPRRPKEDGEPKTEPPPETTAVE